MISKFKSGDIIELPFTEGKPAYGRVLGDDLIGNTRWYEIVLITQPLLGYTKFIPIDIIDKQAKLANKAAQVLWSINEE